MRSDQAGKIRVESDGVSISAFGAGAMVSANLTCYTEEEGRQLAAALKAMVEKRPGEWGVPEPSESPN